ncbi:MAG: hypothetical protein EXR98_07260 [Gemmataceae bacterium]|nr:hypothetical protein [Gemmataceae bacterium]
MLRFRAPDANLADGAVTNLLAVSQVIDAAMQPCHFFAAPELRLTWIAARAETIAWEIFRGRLLDKAQTREQKAFLSWHVIQADAAESTISVKLDVHARQIHVTRGLLAYAWEGYDAAGGIESRETIKWLRELVGTIALADFADLEFVNDELICLIWQAVVGTSRLPLTSVEAPLPAFVFGQFHYVARQEAGATACDSWDDFLTAGLQPTHAWSENVKVVEFALRHLSPAQLPGLADTLAGCWLRESLPRLLRSMFNDVSLSPHTFFTENALALLNALTERQALSVDEKIDFLSRLLRQLARHLTAYDLVTFHHRGANYPDALLLDLALKYYLHAFEAAPDRLLGAEEKPRRRALRQAILMRRHYEGHLVPDLPTSPGENARVLPASHPRVPEEQLTQSYRRRRQLYPDDPLPALLTPRTRQVLAQCVRDLDHLDERVELGLGVFIDRPLGYAKKAAEPDLTPLLAHEAFSPALARRRWQELKKLCTELDVRCDVAGLDSLFENGPWPTGLPHAELVECPRPTAALCDVRKVADDFVILRTLPQGLLPVLDRLRPLQDRYRLAFLADGRCRLCVQALDGEKAPRLVIYDDRLRRRLELAVDASQGFMTRAGVELPRAGLHVLCVWEDTEDTEVLSPHEPMDLRA